MRTSKKTNEHYYSLKDRIFLLSKIQLVWKTSLDTQSKIQKAVDKGLVKAKRSAFLKNSFHAYSATDEDVLPHFLF